ncbi:membrane protein [Erysipelotrichaceae bacterium]|nr:membrane protein [Erysipelotrichaceae bacterium]
MKTTDFFSKRIWLTSLFAVLVGGFLYSVGIHFFVTALGAYTGGVTGLSQLFILTLSRAGIPTPSLGIITILFNIPILIFGWVKVEKRFTILSIISVLYVGLLLTYFDSLPRVLLTEQTFINIVFGGLLVGTGTGLTLRYGGSTGGTDVLLTYASYKRGKSFGGYAILSNMVIVLAAYLLNPDNTEGILITIILFFFVSLVINQVHTKHKRFTAFIVSSKHEKLIEQIHLKCGRGATILQGEGAYAHNKKSVIMTVVSSYQLYTLKDIIARYEPTAFVNIVPTKEIFGNFVNNKTELPLKK